ncbi:MAG TPA: hypothetical protein VH210_10095 [Gaiellaceae bacterium]|nr:hypothetical protein [Gaiellaceae bacterium]
MSWTAANLVPNTLLRWYRRLPFAAGRNLRTAAPTLDEAKVADDRSRRFGSAERLEPLAMHAEEVDHGHGEEHAVNAWRAEQLRRLGLSPTLAEVFAGLVDWHQISKLVERGCSAQLALEIVR